MGVSRLAAVTLQVPRLQFGDQDGQGALRLPPSDSTMRTPNSHAQCSVRKADIGAVSDSKESSLEVNAFEHPSSAIRAAAERVVGRLSLNDAMTQFRNTMVDLALNRGNGSRRAAAKILGVTRPAVQYILRHSDDQNP